MGHINISKNRRWTDGGNNSYKIYSLSKKDRGRYLNTWFLDSDTYYTAWWTLIECDEDTANCLYRHKYNPLSIRIETKPRCAIYIRLHSEDNSSFSCSFTKGCFDTIRDKVMEYVSSHSHINGDDMLDYCMTLGAYEKNYD